MEKPDQEQRKDRDQALRAIRRAFDDARAYRKARQAGDNGNGVPPRDARWEAMIPLLSGKLPLIVAADEVQQIQAAVAFADSQQVKLIILGGYDAPHCAELLKKHDVPVIVSAVFRLPRRRGDDYDAAYTLPERLRFALYLNPMAALDDDSSLLNPLRIIDHGLHVVLGCLESNSTVGHASETSCRDGSEISPPGALHTGGLS